MPPSKHLNRYELERLQKGDTLVFKDVYNDHFGLIHHVVNRCGVSGDDSFDIVQDTFYKLFVKAGQINDPKGVKSWLVTTARNLTLDQLRRQQLIQKHSKIQYLNIEPEKTAGFVSQSELRELEIALLGNLIDEIQYETKDETFALFYREGLTAKEIALRGGEAISTVTNRLSRLRKRFNNKFKIHLEKLHDSVY